MGAGEVRWRGGEGKREWVRILVNENRNVKMM